MTKASRIAAAAGVLAVLLAAMAGCASGKTDATDAGFPTIDRWWK